MDIVIKIDGSFFGNGELTFKQTDLFCVNCGIKHVYEVPEEEEFYEGNCYMCFNCESTFYVPINDKIKDRLKGEQILKEFHKS